MTNSYDVDHGLSQCHPGALEPVEIAQQPGAAPATGNTARDQEMYAAGLEKGEENAKHNAAIRAGAGWLPIESAPKDGTPVLLFARLAGVNFATNSPYAPTIHVGAYRTDLRLWTGSAYRDQREIELEPTHWMPRPAFPDCAAPGVSTVEDAGAQKEAVMDAIADALGEAYDCTRVWHAWSYGTMGPDDFALVAADPSRVAEIATAAIAAMRPAPAAGDALTAAARDVLAERQRQISAEGCTPQRDDEHTGEELARAAACYALPQGDYEIPEPPEFWPWPAAWWKPSERRRELVKSGALILAEIERLDRAAQRKGDA